MATAPNPTTPVREPAGRRASNVFVVLNPKSGTCDRGLARRVIDRHFTSVVGVACKVHETGHEEPLIERIREAVTGGCDLVVAAGGDGTVSAVADALVGTDTPLGIIPLGTANVLARDLGVPVDLEAACALLAGAHALTRIDAMAVRGKHYFTQVGVGIDALMIRDTDTAQKKKFGRLAYLWTAATRLVGLEPRRFELSVDGVPRRCRATQVLVANSGILGQPPFRWGPGIRPDDGALAVCVIRARTVWDFTRLGWYFVTGRHKQDPNVSYRSARSGVSIATTTAKPLPVQADGEIVGETPVTVTAVPGAVRVVVPPDAGRPA